MEAALGLIIARIITTAAKRRASDIHFTVGSKPILRVDESLAELPDEEVITADFIDKFVKSVIDDYHKVVLEKEKNTSFTYIFENKVRIRVNLFYQRNTLTASLKLVPLRVPNLADLGLPKEVYQFLEVHSGLVIISGPYGSGKTTTAAAFIEELNKNRSQNILTVGNPIEYIFFNNKSIVEQREVGRDVNSVIDALHYSRQEDVDVIMVGETEEQGIMPAILDNAATGRLIFCVMNEISAIQVIEKILSQYPVDEQDRGRIILGRILRGIIVQRLLPRIGGGKVLVKEILIASPAVQALIEDNRIKQIESVLQTSQEEGMMSLDQSLARLVKNGEIAASVAFEHSMDRQNLKTMIK